MTDAYRTTTPPGDQAQLDAMASVLVQPRELLCRLSAKYGGEPTPDSAWTHERSNNLTGPAGAWGSGPVDHDAALAALYLRVASDHLAGLATLYRAGEVFYAPRPLVRAAFENGVRVTWILDPDASVRQRCARAAMEEYGSAMETNKAVSRLAGRSSSTAADTKAALSAVKSAINGLFEPGRVSLDGGRRDWQIEGETALSPTDAAAFHTSAVRAAVNGVGVYDALSLFTHPQGFLAREAPNPDGAGGTTFDVTVDFIRRFTTAAVSPIYSGLCLLMSFGGWTLEEFDQWEKEIDGLFPGIFLQTT